jgi:hypothetical protein
VLAGASMADVMHHRTTCINPRHAFMHDCFLTRALTP